MKKKIHPKHYDDCQVTCTCGNTFVTGSTAKKISTEICAACHPFFTGQSKFVDTKGRIDRFEEKRTKAAAYQKNKTKVRSKTKSSPKGKRLVI